MTDICRWDERRLDHAAHEQVADPSGIFPVSLVSFLGFSEKVKEVFEIQEERFREEKNILFNSRMGVREIEKYCRLDKNSESYMKEIYEKKQLSGRTYHKILKVARTIADLSGEENINEEHLSEAVGLRSMEDRLFSKERRGINNAQ